MAFPLRSPLKGPSLLPPVGIVGVCRWTTIIREDLGAASEDDDDGMSRETPIRGAVVRQLDADTEINLMVLLSAKFDQSMQTSGQRNNFILWKRAGIRN